MKKYHRNAVTISLSQAKRAKLDKRVEWVIKMLLREKLKILKNMGINAHQTEESFIEFWLSNLLDCKDMYELECAEDIVSASKWRGMPAASKYPQRPVISFKNTNPRLLDSGTTRAAKLLCKYKFSISRGFALGGVFEESDHVRQWWEGEIDFAEALLSKLRSATV